MRKQKIPAWRKKLQDNYESNQDLDGSDMEVIYTLSGYIQ